MWTPTSYVLDGVYATAEDLRRAVDELHRLTQSPILVAVFSGRRLLRSITIARSGDDGWNERVIQRLYRELPDRLPRAEDKFRSVAELVAEELTEIGCRNPITLSFGGDLDRTGGVGAIVAGGGLDDGHARRQAELVAACALGSRPAAISLETSLELAVLSELREAVVRFRSEPDHGEPGNGSARTGTIDVLLRFADSVLGSAALVAYEADERDPHRFTALQRKSVILASPSEPPQWIPQRVHLRDDLAVPDPPELGGSRFASLDELVAHCFASGDKPRRLVAEIAGEYRAYGVPYGFDDVRRRPIGVLCLVWERDGERGLGSYELAAARVIAQHLARGYNARHSAEAVRLVTRQLTYISDLPSTSDGIGMIDCDQTLPPRLDVKLIAPSVSQIVRGLVNLSGAMSVTCRLLSGADGPCLSRYLVRLHTEGGPSAAASPSHIGIDQAASSVNAWVATTGRPVYLRKLQLHSDGEHYTSPDLTSYKGLERISIYREGVECELCIPIVAERRLVGTVNLEADRPYAFDAMRETVEEYAQLIGIALLESRRRIGVDTMTEVEGLLDYRHRLDAKLGELGRDMKKELELPKHVRGRYLATLDEIHDLIFMRRVGEVDELGPDAELAGVVAEAMRLVHWATRKKDMGELLVESWSKRAREAYSSRVDGESARALTYAIAQALLNVREHGGAGDALANRDYSAMFRFGQADLGGRRNLFVAVSSTCSPEKFKGLDPQRVFREPIERDGRVSLGAFLAGEALRRCGGSAYMRVEKSDEHDWIVDAEFSVPAAAGRQMGNGLSPQVDERVMVRSSG